MHSKDQMVIAGASSPPKLPKSVPPRHSLYLQEPTEPRRPRPGYRALLTHNGTTEVETESTQGSVGISSSEELQCARCD